MIMHLSIVTTLFCSENEIAQFIERMFDSAAKITDDFELIIVDDGSPDKSVQIALSFAINDNRLKIIELSRNFGHQAALRTGLAESKGDTIFLIDSDLEEAPELIDTFYNCLIKNQADSVYGVQEKRKGGLIERLTGSVFYKVINKLSFIPIPENILTVRIMTKQFKDALIQHKEHVVFFHGLCALTGFKQISYTIQKGNKGRTTYTTRKKINLAIDSITSFSNKPLIYLFNTGFACFILPM